FRGFPFLTIRLEECRTWFDRSGLAKINSIKPREKIDDLAPDGARLDPNAGVMPVNRGRLWQMLEGFTHHANGSARKSLAEHQPRRACVHGCMSRFHDFMRRSGNVWCKNQSQTTTFLLCSLD